MKDVILGLGSNRDWQGKKSPALLRLACEKLEELLSDFTVSSVYRTKPMYVENQNDFYNMAVRGKTDDEYSPFAFLEKIHEIEASLGRNRELEIRNGPRSIDIDIEFFGNDRIQTPELIVPHPRINERAFVLIPLLEILKENADFIKREDFAEKLKKIGSAGVEKIISARDFYFAEYSHGTGFGCTDKNGGTD